MSELHNNQIPITPIVSPDISDINYATNLNGVFENINNNFSRLANRDFIKGENGSSVSIKEVKFFDESGKNLTIIGKQLKECIESLSLDSNEYNDILDENGDSISLWDNFNSNPGVLYMIYNTSELSDTSTPISSLYYIFLDGRFSNDKIGIINHEQYDGIRDFSCVLVYDKSISNGNFGTGGFKVLMNAFPTIYYEKGLGLCWRINGNNSKIPVQGVPGKNGINSYIQIVKCNTITENNSIIKGEVSGVYNVFNGYLPISEVNVSELENCSALILSPNQDDINGNNFYFGMLNIEDDINGNKVLYAYCNSENAINYGLDTESFINIMKNISITNNGKDTSSGIKGLFIPITNEINSKQSVHLLTSTSISNLEGVENDKKSDIVFTPIEDINSLTINDANNLLVEKYLYLKVNQESNILHDLQSQNANVVSKLKKYGYILKYKLTDIIKNTKIDNQVNKYFETITTPNTSGSRRFGKATVTIDGSTISKDLNDDNVVYYKYDDVNSGKQVSTVSDHLLTIPSEFINRMNSDNSAGIYRWELCKTKNHYDVDELINSEVNNEYDFDNVFDVIYTTTINPSISTNFLWFNGISLIRDTDEVNLVDNKNKNGYYQSNSKFVIYGWHNGINSPIFDFVKFVPVYKNSFRVVDDTSLNLNYNVNITGDNNDSKKNITVHGSVNCDDLNVYSLTATGEIKNIYTKDIIVGDNGLKLGKNENNDYSINIDSSGNINSVGGINSKYVNVSSNIKSSANNTIITDDLMSNQISSKELFINDENEDRRIYIGSNNSNNKFNIELNDVNSIDIKRNTGLYNTIKNELPVLQNNEAGIVVSNQIDNDSQIFFYGNKSKVGKNYNGGPGTHEGKESIVNTDFEYAKNFNIHRLALSSNSKSNTEYKASNLVSQTNSFNYINSSSDELQNEYDAKFNGKNISENYITIASFTKTNDSSEINESKPIIISFKKDLACQIGIKGKCSNGRWPVLSDKSYVKLHLYCSTGNIGTIECLTKTLSLDFTTNTTENNSGFEWRGYDYNGKNLADDYDNKWRYYTYQVRLKDFVIDKDLMINNEKVIEKINNAYKAGQTITFYIYPEIYLCAKGQKYGAGIKKVISGLQVSSFTFVNSNSSPNSVLTSFNGTYYNKSVWNNKASDFGSINYSLVSEIDGASSIKSTTICKDGIVMRAGDYVFGLGYAQKAFNHSDIGYDTSESGEWRKKSLDDSINYLSNIPILFYHKYSPNYYKDNNEKEDSKGIPVSEDVTINGYAGRMQAIPLDDLFEMIKWWNENKDKIDQLTK